MNQRRRRRTKSKKEGWSEVKLKKKFESVKSNSTLKFCLYRKRVVQIDANDVYDEQNVYKRVPDEMVRQSIIIGN